MAVLSFLLVARPRGVVSPWYPFLLFIYPVFETLFSIWRKRLVRGDSPGVPDGLHLHMLIFRRLVRWAKGRKVRSIYGEVLESNLPMQALAASLGFRREYPGEPGLVRMVLDLPPPKPKLPPPPPGMTAAGR